MFPTDPPFWFCCLNPREREVLRLTCEGLIITLFVGMPLAAWNLLWLTFPGSGQAVKDAFLSIYILRIDTILVGEPPVPLDVVVTDAAADYLLLAAYLLTTEATCVDGCQQSRFD